MEPREPRRRISCLPHPFCIGDVERSYSKGPILAYAAIRTPYPRQAGQATGQALASLLDWLTHAGQACAADEGYVPCRPESGSSPAPRCSR